MHKILTLNAIALKGLEQFPRSHYEVASEIGNPDAIVLRSHKLGEDEITPEVKAIARAGAGVNNIPLAPCTDRGIVVFNTPGANANAVKELVLAGLLLGSRDIAGGMEYVRTLKDITDERELNVLLEQEKKRFKGEELVGKTLGVVGLGAIGSLVAEVGLMLGMKVMGYDPAISVAAAWRLPSNVQSMENLPSLVSKADFISLHLPVLDSTRGLINSELLKHFKPTARLMNFARSEVVDTHAVAQALSENTLGHYITDFPSPELIREPKAILMPHIGASTLEAEENCAVMAAMQIRDFLEYGNIKNSVNFPALALEPSEGYRLAISNRNVPKMLGSILAIISDHDINVIDMLNKSRDDVAYTLIDIADQPEEALLDEIRGIDGVINVRLIEQPA